MNETWLPQVLAGKSSIIKKEDTDYFVRERDMVIFYRVHTLRYESLDGEVIDGREVLDILFEDVPGYLYGDDIERVYKTKIAVLEAVA